MKILFFLSIFLIFISVNAQNRDKIVDVGPEFKALMDKFNNCAEDKGLNCIELINDIIEKGKQEKVPFLDYLYGRKAYYFWNQQELDSTMVYAKLSIDHPHPIEKQRRDVESYNLLANAYSSKGDLNTAMEYYLKITAILENGGSQIHLGYVYSNIAIILGQIENSDKEIEYLLKAYKLLKENNDKKLIATIASNLATGYFYKRDTFNVKKWAQKAIELSGLSNDMIAKSQSFQSLSLVEKDLNKSLEYAKQAVKYADEYGNKINMVSAYYIYAQVLNQLGESEEALKYAVQAVDIAEEVGDNQILLKASNTAASIYYKLGMKEKSAGYYHIYATLKDSISTVENAKAINDLNIKYESNKKEKKIAEQKLKIQQQRSNLLYSILGAALLISILGGGFIYNRKAQKLRLKQLQQEKENAILNSFILGEERERRRISHELHDGVAAMIGAAKMTLESIPHLSSETKQVEQFSKVKRILENTHADIRHIAHNLLPTVLEKEGLIQATEHFISEINDTNLVNIIVKDKSSKGQEYPKQLQLVLFRIIQELVNNIIKHSQAQNAEIIFSNSPDGLQIEISDDGIGYEGDKLTGNQGLYSISQRLKSIGGNFKITKIRSGGTQAKVEVTV